MATDRYIQNIHLVIAKPPSYRNDFFKLYLNLLKAFLYITSAPRSGPFHHDREAGRSLMILLDGPEHDPRSPLLLVPFHSPAQAFRTCYIPDPAKLLPLEIEQIPGTPAALGACLFDLSNVA